MITVILAVRRHSFGILPTKVSFFLVLLKKSLLRTRQSTNQGLLTHRCDYFIMDASRFGTPCRLVRPHNLSFLCRPCLQTRAQCAAGRLLRQPGIQDRDSATNMASHAKYARQTHRRSEAAMLYRCTRPRPVRGARRPAWVWPGSTDAHVRENAARNQRRVLVRSPATEEERSGGRPARDATGTGSQWQHSRSRSPGWAVMSCAPCIIKK